MPRIDKLEMQGFKSFSKKTILHFPSNFSVICGPNGSGKSNVLDAVCFVLGRTSAKSMRAGKMLEMLYNGGATKSPSEFAKVTLHFDNSDRVLPVEDDAVAVSRKVNRRGVSIYKVNGKTVTRETVLEVLRASHIHPDGHNIILQGDVTEIVEMSPNQRREIIDEVSGIAEFDQKRDKAHKELSTVEERLKEAGIVLTERYTSLQKLELEKMSAEKYRVLTKDLDKLRASAAKIKLQEAEKAMGTMDEKIKKSSTEELDKEIAIIDKDLSKFEKEMQGISKKIFDKVKDIDQIKELEKLKAELSSKRDRIDFSKAEIGRLDETIKRLEYLQQRSMDSSSNRAVKEILRLNRTGVYGTVANLSNVPSEYQTAIEVAAGGHLHNIVVSDKEVAIGCVRHLKETKMGRATFLPLDKIRERNGAHLKNMLNTPGVIGVAIDLIDFDTKYYHAFSFVLGDTLVVENIDVAKRLGIGRARFVTLDGDMAERSGAIIGGFYKKDKNILFDKTEITNYENKKKNLVADIRLEEQELLRIAAQVEKLTARVGKDDTQVVDIQSNSEDIERKIEILRLKRKDFYDKKVTSQEEINQWRIRKARLEAELDNIKAEFQNYTKSETYSSISLRDLESRIHKTLSEINALGPINMKALEEYENIKKFYDDMKGKVDTLAVERERVFMMMSEVEEQRRETFTKTLEEVTNQFRVVYNDLTSGEGTLELDDPENIESGLLIRASPPGRKVLNIDSMSGGEKTMTAMAFLFAIQKFRPAPFYILDEVDAALDKPNTKKVTNLVEKYSKDNQFIVISHNDGTIQAASCVYGVTMEEGESKLLGIKMPN
ncbi:MAG: AAA family ATPase [Candidatus Aenigmarchaeota archaeon]|nr:AAA family ATPase [Candidatus Aenigmarchaeota archaeon]